MVKRIITAMAAVVSALVLNAQTADSLVVRRAPQVDSSLVGKSIFADMKAVTVSQPKAVEQALMAQIRTNPSRTISGYRVRIYSDNSQNSRAESEAVMKRFSAICPGVAAYHSYQSPFFRVTVGDFRTKSEAQELLQTIVREFPAAFVVKENISFPVADKEHSYVVDTVAVRL